MTVRVCACGGMMEHCSITLWCIFFLVLQTNSVLLDEIKLLYFLSEASSHLKLNRSQVHSLNPVLGCYFCDIASALFPAEQWNVIFHASRLSCHSVSSLARLTHPNIIIFSSHLLFYLTSYVIHSIPRFIHVTWFILDYLSFSYIGIFNFQNCHIKLKW